MNFAMAAAEEVLMRCISKAAMDSMVAHIVGTPGGLDARIIIPHPAFDDAMGEEVVQLTDSPRNAIPFAYAAFLARNLGLSIDEEIVQIARVGRTKLSTWPRFLYQPKFGGVVRPGQTYVLADDVVSTAGTCAALRSYIARNGGHVIFATALANSIGKNQGFSVTKQIVNQLAVDFGPELNQFWTETIGHDIHCLTEAEAAFLLRELSNVEQAKGCPRGPELLQRLRGKLDAAAAKEG